jgi:hypothetical protein
LDSRDNVDVIYQKYNCIQLIHGSLLTMEIKQYKVLEVYAYYSGDDSVTRKKLTGTILGSSSLRGPESASSCLLPGLTKVDAFDGTSKTFHYCDHWVSKCD